LNNMLYLSFVITSLERKWLFYLELLQFFKSIRLVRYIPIPFIFLSDSPLTKYVHLRQSVTESM